MSGPDTPSIKKLCVHVAEQKEHITCYLGYIQNDTKTLS